MIRPTQKAVKHNVPTKTVLARNIMNQPSSNDSPSLRRPLTEQDIDAACPDLGKELTLTDTGGAGHIVRVRRTKAGKITATYAYRYTNLLTGKPTKQTIGQYPDMSIQEARKAWSVLEARNKTGRLFPVNARYVNPCSTTTLRNAAEQWFETITGTEEHIRDTKNRMENHILRAIGETPIDKVNIPMLRQTLLPLKNRGCLSSARRIITNLVAIFDIQVGVETLPYHQVYVLRKYFPKKKEVSFKAVDPKEFSSVLSIITTARLHIQTRCLMLFQIHTMVRPVEAVRARYCQIDWEAQTWTFIVNKGIEPEPHVVPLSSQAMEILRILKDLNGDTDYIFPSLQSGKKPHMSSQTCNSVLKRNGFKGRQHSHGFRALASTIMNNLGMDYDLIEKSLSHKEKNETRKVYNRADYIVRRRELHQWWSNYVEAQFKGNYPNFLR